MNKAVNVLIVLMVSIALTATAHAYRIRLGGNLATGVFYSLQTGSAYVGAANNRDIRQPDVNQFNLAVSGGALWCLFLSDDKSTGVHISIGLTAGPAAGANAVTLNYAYGWYTFEKCRIEVGHTDNLFASMSYAPYAALGSTYMPDGSGGGFNEFGKLYSGRYSQIALYCDLGNWTLMASLGMAGVNTNNWPQAGGNLAVIEGHVIYPRLALAVEYRGKWFSVAPGFSVFRTEWESWQGATGLEDDHVLSWCLVLPFRVALGNFGFRGEVGLGRNWIVPNMLSTFQGGQWWGGANDNGNWIKAADTRLYTACLGFYYRVGRATLWLSGGWQMEQNGSSDAPGSWRHGQNVRYALVLAVPYQVNRHFLIGPEVGYYFYGWDPTQDVGGSAPGAARATSTTADRGLAWIVGVQFQVLF